MTTTAAAYDAMAAMSPRPNGLDGPDAVMVSFGESAYATAGGQRKPTIHHDVSDWHGKATLGLPADMPPADVEHRLAIARSIHGPESREACCVRLRARLEGA